MTKIKGKYIDNLNIQLTSILAMNNVFSRDILIDK